MALRLIATLPLLLLIVLVAPSFGPAGPATPALFPAAHAPSSAARSGHATGGELAPAHAGPMGSSSPWGGRFPHSGPIQVGRTPSFNGHYYAGSVYNGTPVNSTSLSATINIPLDLPQTGDFYYVLLSVWDDAGSYDQVGFTNSNGVWGFTYSSTAYCGSYYYYNPDAFTLNEGTTYTFEMTVASGNVNFTATYPDGKLAFWWVQPTGGHHFVDSAMFGCNYYGYNVSFYDLTDYEEVYATTNNFVPYNWHFGSNAENGVALAPWSIFVTAPNPGTINVVISGANTTIANELYELAPGPGTPTGWTVVSGSRPLSIFSNLSVTALVGTPVVTLGAYSLPGGWSAKFGPTSSTAPFVSVLNLTIPGSTGGGNYTIGFNATDATGGVNQITLWLNLLSSASMNVVALPHPYADVNQNVTIYVSSGGSISGVTLSWSGLPPGCNQTSETSFACGLTTAGTFPITATAHDVYGNSATSSPLVYIVYPDPTISLLVSPATADVTQPVQVYGTATGGAGPSYSFRYSGLPTGCTVAGPNASCTPTVAGNYSVRAVVTDASGYGTTSAAAIMQIVPAPSVVLLLSSQSADVGQTVWANASGSGGAGGLAYTWTSLPSGCTATGASAVCNFTQPGDNYLSVEVQDSAGIFSAPQRLLIVVSPAVTVRLAAPRGSVDLGQSTTFTATVAGGAPSYTYVYSGLPSGCGSSNVAALLCAPTAPGTFAAVTVAVTDSNGYTVRASQSFSVYAAPSLSLSAVPATVTQGGSVTFTATLTGGSGGATYDWTDLPGGCQSSTTATVSCAPTGTGSFTINVTVTDSNGAHASAVTTLVVAAPAALAGNGGLLLVGGVVAAAAVVAVAALLWMRKRRASPVPAENPQ